MCFLWFIVSIVQVVVAYIAYVIYHDTVKLLENCDHIEYIRDVCVCYDTGDTRITAIGKESSGINSIGIQEGMNQG